MTKDNRYIYLLCALLLFLMVGPLARQYLPDQAVFLVDLSIMVALAIGVWTVASSRRTFLRAVALVAITLVILLSRLYFESISTPFLPSHVRWRTWKPLSASFI